MKGLITHRTTLPEDEIHEILSNGRRRRIIKELQNALDEVILRDLTERIAEAETGQSPAPRDIRQSVYNSLHQTHLPKLDREGIIDYDTDRKTILLKDEFYHVDVYMEVVTKYGITWSQYYRTLGIMGLLMVVLAAVDAPVVSTVDTAVWAGGFLGVFVVSMAAQLWSRRWLYFRQLLNRVGATGHKSPNRR